MKVLIASRWIGDGEPCVVVAEGGQNHSGALNLALQMIRSAKAVGADAIKWQKRVPEISVPWQQNALRDTPWGALSYLDYRRKLELGRADYDAIDAECRTLGLPWSASPWDLPSLDFLLDYHPPFLKVASACLTDHELLKVMAETGVPIIASTGMSTVEEIDRAVEILGTTNLILLHCQSCYPCPPEDLNLAAMLTLRDRYRVPVGLSDHTVGLWLSLCAVAMGACVIERHFTLNRSSFGTDQSSSVEPQGLRKLIEQIRRFESARGDGVIRVLPSEVPVREKLRRCP